MGTLRLVGASYAFRQDGSGRDASTAREGSLRSPSRFAQHDKFFLFSLGLYGWGASYASGKNGSGRDASTAREGSLGSPFRFAQHDKGFYFGQEEQLRNCNLRPNREFRLLFPQENRCWLRGSRKIVAN